MSASNKVILLIGKRSPIRFAWPLWKKSDRSITDEGTVLNQDFKEFIQSYGQ
jgi:hypothetical protein